MNHSEGDELRLGESAGEASFWCNIIGHKMGVNKTTLYCKRKGCSHREGYDFNSWLKIPDATPVQPTCKHMNPCSIVAHRELVLWCDNCGAFRQQGIATWTLPKRESRESGYLKIIDTPHPAQMADFFGEYVIGTLLPTKDGRKHSNAIIEDIAHNYDLSKNMYYLLTDDGKEVKVGYGDMLKAFHVPRHICNPLSSVGHHARLRNNQAEMSTIRGKKNA